MKDHSPEITDYLLHFPDTDPATEYDQTIPGGSSRSDPPAGKKKMGRPTTNPRTEKIGFRMAPAEIEDIRRCSEAMQTQRVNAVVEGIRLLKEKLNLD